MWLTQKAPYYKSSPWWKKLLGINDPEVPESEFTSDEYKAVTLFVLGWCRNIKIIRYEDLGNVTVTIVPTPSENLAGMSNLIITTNMATIFTEDRIAIILRMLKDNDTYTYITDFTQLHLTLCSQFPSDLIDILINKTYRAIDNATPTPNAIVPVDIHARVPFFWVIPFINLVIQRYTID